MQRVGGSVSYHCGMLSTLQVCLCVCAYVDTKSVSTESLETENAKKWQFFDVNEVEFGSVFMCFTIEEISDLFSPRQLHFNVKFMLSTCKMSKSVEFQLDFVKVAVITILTRFLAVLTIVTAEERETQLDEGYQFKICLRWKVFSKSTVCN